LAILDTKLDDKRKRKRKRRKTKTESEIPEPNSFVEKGLAGTIKF
jgi:hypothetical protein